MIALFYQHLAYIGATTNPSSGAAGSNPSTRQGDPLINSFMRKRHRKGGVEFGPDVIDRDGIQSLAEIHDFVNALTEYDDLVNKPPSTGDEESTPTSPDVNMEVLDGLLKSDLMKDGLAIRNTLRSALWATSTEGGVHSPLTKAYDELIQKKQTLGKALITTSFILEATLYVHRWSAGDRTHPPGYETVTPATLDVSLGKFWPVPRQRLDTPICDWDLGMTYDALKYICLDFKVDRKHTRSLDWGVFMGYTTALYHHVCLLTVQETPRDKLSGEKSTGWCSRVQTLDATILNDHIASDDAVFFGDEVPQAAASMRVRDHNRQEKEKAKKDHAKKSGLYFRRKKLEAEEAKRKADEQTEIDRAAAGGVVSNASVEKIDDREKRVDALVRLQEENVISELLDKQRPPSPERKRKGRGATAMNQKNLSVSTRETTADRVAREAVEEYEHAGGDQIEILARKAAAMRREEMERTDVGMVDDLFGTMMSTFKETLPKDVTLVEDSLAEGIIGGSKDDMEEDPEDRAFGGTRYRWAMDIVVVLDGAMSQRVVEPRPPPEQ